MVGPGRSHLEPGRHWISPVNLEAELTSDFSFPSPLGLIDSTLRKMCYTPGWLATTAGFIRVAEALANAGVGDESINLDWWGDPVPSRRAGPGHRHLGGWLQLCYQRVRRRSAR